MFKKVLFKEKNSIVVVNLEDISTELFIGDLKIISKQREKYIKSVSDKNVGWIVLDNNFSIIDVGYFDEGVPYDLIDKMLGLFNFLIILF